MTLKGSLIICLSPQRRQERKVYLLFLFSFERKENKNYKPYGDIIILFEYMLIITSRHGFFVSPKRSAFSFLSSSALWNACPVEFRSADLPWRIPQGGPIPPGSPKRNNKNTLCELCVSSEVLNWRGKRAVENMLSLTRIAKLGPSAKLRVYGIN